MTATSPQPYYYSSIFFIFIVPALGGLLFGYDIGATSYAVVTLDASPTVTGLFVAAPSAGALLGSSIVFFIADSIGRLKELRIGSVLYLLGAIMESSQHSNVIMFLGRLLYGLGIGFSMHGAPTYLGEMLPSDIRGALVSLKEVFIVIGILLGYTTGYLYAETNYSYPYLLSLLGSSTMLLLSFQIPFSARWLVSKGRNEEALKALGYVYHNPDSEYNSLLRAHQEQDSWESNSDGIFHPSRRAALRAGIGLVVLQQVTGQPSVLSYATPIFQSAGLASYSSVLVALFKLVATSSAVFTVERYGRKQLLYVGCSLMLLALVVLSFAFGKYDDDDSTAKSVVQTTAILVAMFVYIGGYQIGFGPMSWLIMSEVFPQSIRGQAVAVAVQVNFLLNAVVQFGVPVLESWWGLSSTFGLFGILTAYSLYFVYQYVLETKGLTLEEIERLFQGDTIVSAEEDTGTYVAVNSDDDEEGTQLLTSVKGESTTARASRRDAREVV